MCAREQYHWRLFSDIIYEYYPGIKGGISE